MEHVKTFIINDLLNYIKFDTMAIVTHIDALLNYTQCYTCMTFVTHINDF